MVLLQPVAQAVVLRADVAPDALLESAVDLLLAGLLAALGGERVAFRQPAGGFGFAQGGLAGALGGGLA